MSLPRPLVVHDARKQQICATATACDFPKEDPKRIQKEPMSALYHYVNRNVATSIPSFLHPPKDLCFVVLACGAKSEVLDLKV